MPEVAIALRWPDGATTAAHSPSRCVEEELTPGGVYPVEEFMRRAGTALREAAERVRAIRGFACTAAPQQLAALEEEAARRAPGGDGDVTVVAMTVLGGPPDQPGPLPEEVEVAVIGGGQAGLSASAHLSARGVGHVVLERDRAFRAWSAERWASFSLVTPNWQCVLPGFPYDGDDPDGFMVREEVVAFLERFRAATAPPLHEGVEVTALRRAPDEMRFVVETGDGTVVADQVVVAVGGYHRPRVPALAAAIPGHVTQLHSSQYERPEALPDGPVLVVGSAQSGAQIAEDLHRSGRETHLAVGRAPRIARRYRGRDVVAWLADMGHYDLPIDRHPMGRDARREANHYVTGRDGGHDIDLRAFAREGMTLHGRLEDVDPGGVLRFGADLVRDLDHADDVMDRNKDAIDEHILRDEIHAPQEPRYHPVWAAKNDGATPLDLHAADAPRTIVWATGFSSDWSWIEPAAFDERGYPDGDRGATSSPGLYVVGLPWLVTWGSGRFAAIARDTEHVADQIVARRAMAGRRAA